MKIASRNGGNGGYKQKKAVPDKPIVRRKLQSRDYHGKNTKRK